MNKSAREILSHPWDKVNNTGVMLGQRGELTDYARVAVNYLGRIKESAGIALQFGCKNVINTKGKQLSAWEADALIGDILQTVLLSCN